MGKYRPEKTSNLHTFYAVKGIKNLECQTTFHVSIDDINTVSMNTGNNYVLKQLESFIFELVKTPMKEISISRAIFSTTRPRSIVLLLLGLAVATDNRLASKWINILTWVLVEFSLFFLNDLRCLFHIATLP